MTDTETKYQCKTCGRLFDVEGSATDHTTNHRRKAPVRKVANGNPSKFVREIEVDVKELEEKNLYELADENPPPESDVEYLAENDPETGEETSLKEFEE